MTQAKKTLSPFGTRLERDKDSRLVENKKVVNLYPKIENVVLRFNEGRKDDATVESADWIESGKPLTDAELDSLDMDSVMQMEEVTR